MKTVICDICRKREAERCFKIKEQKAYTSIDEYGFLHRTLRWTRIDICKTCYEVFVELRKGVSK